MMNTFSSFPWLRAEDWDQFPGLVHGFSARMIDQTAALVALSVADLSLYTLKQVHGNNIVIVDQARIWEKKPEADGVVTAQPGALLGIATADCVPLLVAEPQKGIAAALHAGWRGTLKGITVRAVEMLADEWEVDPQHLHVALGPAIGGCCYEVGSDVGEAVCQRWGEKNSAAWRSVGEKGFLDLRAINVAQLESVGVPDTQISLVGPCTFCDPAFASYRREGTNVGRQLSVIGWRT